MDLPVIRVIFHVADQRSDMAITGFENIITRDQREPAFGSGNRDVDHTCIVDEIQAFRAFVVSQEAKGEYLILLDAESQIVNVGWIESLLNQAQRPEVGVVGVRLVDREGTITQAGLVLGLNGGVGSGFVGEPKTSRGYMQRLVVEQNYSAVSSACLMIAKALYDSLGGLDEEAFAESLGDVDLCLKAAQAGYLTVWTPHVQVVHSGVVNAPQPALGALAGKWAAQFAQDEAYNANLDLDGKGFTLAV